MQGSNLLPLVCGIFAFVRANVHLKFTLDTSIPNTRRVTDNRLYAVIARTLSHCAVECRHQKACITFGYIPGTGFCQFYDDEITEKSSWVQIHSIVKMDYYRVHCSDIPGYLLYRSIGKCMRHVTDKQNFTAADETCRNEGTTLFEPKSRDQMDFLYKDYSTRFWVGGFPDEHLSTWFWFSNEEIPSNSTLWVPGQPENYDSCLEAKTSNGVYGLNDKNCDIAREFYCETIEWN